MVDPNQLREELRRMKTLINQNPSIKAKFDKDGNGVIDGEEWEEVRQLVIRRLERKDAEAKAAKEMHAQAQAAGISIPPETPAPEASGAVALQILDSDLLTPLDPPQASAQAAGLPEFILEQKGGVVGQVFEGMKRREYEVYSRDGTPVARIEQVENEMLQDLTHRGWSIPDLNFRVHDLLSGEMLTMSRTDALGRPERIGVMNATGGEIAHARFKGSLLEMEAMVHSTLQPLGLQVKKKLWKPWTYTVTNEFDEQVGAMEKGWTGLGGFMTGGNKMHLRIDPEKSSPELTWALIAAALMFDLNNEVKADSTIDTIRSFF